MICCYKGPIIYQSMKCSESYTHTFLYTRTHLHTRNPLKPGIIYTHTLFFTQTHTGYVEIRSITNTFFFTDYFIYKDMNMTNIKNIYLYYECKIIFLNKLSFAPHWQIFLHLEIKLKLLSLFPIENDHFWKKTKTQFLMKFVLITA